MIAVLELLPRFRQLPLVLRKYEEREGWTATDIQAYQLQCLNRVWRHAREHVPFYRQLADGHDLPERFDSLAAYTQQMPILSKQDVRRFPERFLSRNPARGSWHWTGGSTGVPTKIYWEHQSHRSMLRAKYRCEQAYGLEVLDHKVLLWGHHGSLPPGLAGRFQKTLRPLQDRLRHRMRVSAYDLSPRCLRYQLPRIRHFSPASIYGYSSAVHLLSEAAAAEGLIFPRLKAAVLTAEPADRQMCSAVAENLGCAAASEYGSVECGLIAYLMPDGVFRTRDDVVFVETLADGQGAYDLVISVLGNASFPLLRYRIEDTTSRPRQQPASGFGVLADVQGRHNDMLVSQSGRRLHSMAVKHVIESWPGVRRFTARQDASGDLRVTLETPQGLAQHALGSLRQQLMTLLDGYAVDIDAVDRIPGNLAGKHRWIISELAALRPAGSESRSGGT